MSKDTEGVFASKIVDAVETWLKRNPVSAPFLDDERAELAEAVNVALWAAVREVDTPFRKARAKRWQDAELEGGEFKAVAE